MATLVLTIASAVLASGITAAIGLWRRHAQERRAKAARIREYINPGRISGRHQPWRNGFYDIRDWADGVRAYLSFGSQHPIDFNRIRMPGHRYVEHLLVTGRVPDAYIPDVIILREYCELLAQTFAQVLAADLHRPRILEPVDVERMLRMTVEEREALEPAAAKLAVAVYEQARALADPPLDRIRRKAPLAEMFGPPSA